MRAVDVILPALNEAPALPGVLRRLPEGYRAIVVDNGSQDDTASIARALGAVVVTELQRGFGAAVHAGLLAAEADTVCIMDADGSFDPGELLQLVAQLDTAEVELVLGRRVPLRGNAWPRHARLANYVLAHLIRRYTGVRVHDLGPMRAARRAYLLDLGLQDRRSGYPLEMLLATVRAGGRVVELPVRYAPRLGRSKVTGTLRGTLVAIHDMRGQLRAHARSRQ